MTKSINLIEGAFTPREAVDVIYDILDVKINFHKLERLAKREGNQNDTCVYDNNRIEELKASQEDLIQFFKDINTSGKKITVKSTIEISITE